MIRKFCGVLAVGTMTLSMLGCGASHATQVEASLARIKEEGAAFDARCAALIREDDLRIERQAAARQASQLLHEVSRIRAALERPTY